MNLKVESGSSNYCAEIVEILSYKKHENANSLWVVNINFNNVITGVEPKIGDIMVYFPVMSKINNEFLSSINGFTDPLLNKDQTVKGFFTSKCRVKPIKLRGIASEGYLHPIKDLNNFLGVEFTKSDVGKTFNSVNDVILCDKYVIESKQSNSVNQGKKPKVSRLVENQFRFHVDTNQLRREIFKISPDDIIGLHTKKHGCVFKDTIVDTLEFGNKTIEEVVSKKLQCRIKAYDTLEKEIVYAPIDKHYLKKNSGDWYEIELENEMKLKITANNPVWMPLLNCYREVKELQEGDSLLID